MDLLSICFQLLRLRPLILAIGYLQLPAAPQALALVFVMLISYWPYSSTFFSELRPVPVRAGVFELFPETVPTSLIPFKSSTPRSA
jgi:hypothetical protein